jgi:hypothetical protein
MPRGSNNAHRLMKISRVSGADRGRSFSRIRTAGMKPAAREQLVLF